MPRATAAGYPVALGRAATLGGCNTEGLCWLDRDIAQVGQKSLNLEDRRQFGFREEVGFGDHGHIVEIDLHVAADKTASPGDPSAYPPDG